MHSAVPLTVIFLRAAHEPLWHCAIKRFDAHDLPCAVANEDLQNYSISFNMFVWSSIHMNSATKKRSAELDIVVFFWHLSACWV